MMYAQFIFFLFALFYFLILISTSSFHLIFFNFRSIHPKFFSFFGKALALLNNYSSFIISLILKFDLITISFHFLNRSIKFFVKVLLYIILFYLRFFSFFRNVNLFFEPTNTIIDCYELKILFTFYSFVFVILTL